MPEEVGSVRLIMRVYFSSYLLWTAEDADARAARIEEGRDRPSRFDIGHRACVLTAILAAANFLEAMINELYQDAHDSHNVTGEGYVAPLAEEVRERLAAIWRSTDEGSKLRPLDKYQLLLSSAGREQLDEGAQPYQDALLVVQLRNAIAHYQPEDLSADSPAKMERRLRGKFPDNPLMAGAGNPWWPDHCLGHGCAEWAWRSALALADHVSDELGIRPNYRRLREADWEGLGDRPGAGS